MCSVAVIIIVICTCTGKSICYSSLEEYSISTCTVTAIFAQGEIEVFGNHSSGFFEQKNNWKEICVVLARAA